jgi:Lrp/AsnC family transcriptional regulator, leucine-responsive regulatory protein
MVFDSKVRIDSKDWALLDLLQRNARQSLAELGRKLRLSPPAVAERMKRLEERGVIRGYRAELNLSALGRPLHVYLRVVVQPRDYGRFKKKIQASHEIFECHHVTGAESFILRAAVADVQALEALIEQLTAFGPTTTSVILSTAQDRRHFVPALQWR